MHRKINGTATVAGRKSESFVGDDLVLVGHLKSAFSFVKPVMPCGVGRRAECGV